MFNIGKYLISKAHNQVCWLLLVLVRLYEGTYHETIESKVCVLHFIFSCA